MHKVMGNVVDIHTNQIYPACIEISTEGKISRIQKDMSLLSVSFAEAKKLLYIMCGLIDAHIHEESSFLLPSEYARVALSQGVIGAVTDFHEITHILGRKGFDLLAENTRDLRFYFSLGAPSQEVEGLYMLPDIEKLLSAEEVSHLGEMNDFPSILLHDVKELLKLYYAKKVHKPVDGCAPGLSKDNLKKYIESGVSTDHSCVSFDDALEKITTGLKIQLSLDSNSDSVKDYIPLINTYSDAIMLCSNTESCYTMSKGYIRNAVKKAVKNGADLYAILRCACMNPVTHYGMKTGLLREGDNADFLIVSNLEDFSIINVYVKGSAVYPEEHTEILPQITYSRIPVRNDFCTQPIHADSILVKTPHKLTKVYVISCFDGESGTTHKKVVMSSHGGYLSSMPEIDCLKLVYYSRYGSFRPQIAFVSGFNLKEGALAMSVSHDEHNIIAIGICDSDIVDAVNRVIALCGGIVFVHDGTIISETALPLAGIISVEPAEKVIEGIQSLKNALFVHGCPLAKPITTLSNLAYSSAPLLKLTRSGLFDAALQEYISLFCEE